MRKRTPAELRIMANPISIVYARELRQKQTPAEKLMWYLLRNRKFHGLKFLRQHPIFICSNEQSQIFYIADFYCAAHKFVLELDGDYRFNRKEYDDIRDKRMSEQAIRVLRIKNEVVLKDYKSVLATIKEFLNL